MRSPIIVLITAAGAGSRFSKNNILTPKPLIQVHGKTLLEYTLDSFEFKSDDTLIIATQSKDNVPQSLSEILKVRFSELQIVWIEVDKLLQGQLSTAVYVADKINKLPLYTKIKSRPLLIHNCDTGFSWSENFIAQESDGTMPVFLGAGNHWSFGVPSKEDPRFASRIVEKERISSLTSIGLYGFKSLEYFHSMALPYLENADIHNGEHYIAPMLNWLIKRSAKISLPKANNVRIYGTPH